MKRYLKLVVALVTLSVAVALMAIVATGDTSPVATVKAYNLTFGDSVYISYAVEFENVPEGAETGLLIWEEPQTEYTASVGAPEKITERAGVATIGGKRCNVYNYKGISAKEMTKDIYAVAFVKDGENYTYSELSKYSVLQYAYNKLGLSGLGTPTTDGELVDLINSLLRYGAAAQSFFGENTENLATATYYMLTLDGGSLSDLSNAGLYRSGVSLSVSAPEEQEGQSFVKWIDSDGNTVSEAASFTYTVPEKNTTLTAVYE